MTNIPTISDYNRKYQEYLEAKAAATPAKAGRAA